MFTVTDVTLQVWINKQTVQEFHYEQGHIDTARKHWRYLMQSVKGRGYIKAEVRSESHIEKGWHRGEWKRETFINKKSVSCTIRAKND